MQAYPIKAYRVEVLENNVQKYASSTVSGGGGHVSSVNGQTFGRIENVKTEVTHHEDQDIWVRDLKTSKEFQVNIKNNTLPVRSGHILRLAFDEITDCWERVINETTGESSFGNGSFNPRVEKKYKKEYPQTFFYLGVGLLIPLVNFLVGFIAIACVLVMIPTSFGKIKITGVGIRLLSIVVSGLGIFGLSYFFILGEGFFVRMLSLTALLLCFVMYIRLTKKSFKMVVDIIEDRSSALDSSIKEENFSR